MVTLYALGGVTRMVPTKPFSNGQGFIISAAGSAVRSWPGWWCGWEPVRVCVPPQRSADGSFGAMVGIAIGQADLLALGVAVFIWVSVVWGLFNWVPIRGLDGHNMLGRYSTPPFHQSRLRSLFESFRSSWASGCAVWAWVSGQRFVALFVLLLTFSDVFPRAVGSVAGGR